MPPCSFSQCPLPWWVSIVSCNLIFPFLRDLRLPRTTSHTTVHWGGQMPLLIFPSCTDHLNRYNNLDSSRRHSPPVLFSNKPFSQTVVHRFKSFLYQKGVGMSGECFLGRVYFRASLRPMMQADSPTRSHNSTTGW